LGLSSAVTRGTAACSEPNVQFGSDATVIASSRETKLNRADHNTRFLFGLVNRRSGWADQMVRHRHWCPDEQSAV